MYPIENDLECSICKSKLDHKIEFFEDKFQILCPRCGDFALTRSLFRKLQNEKENDRWRWTFSHYIRRHYYGTDKVILGSDDFTKIIENYPLPNPAQQSIFLLEYLGKKISYPSDSISLDANLLAAIIGAKNISGVDYISQDLQDGHFIIFQVPGMGQTNRIYKMTIHGWKEFNKIARGDSEYNLAFMAMQYDDTLLDNIYENHIKDTMKEIGFEIRRLNEIPKAGLIDNHLRAEIKKSRLILADLTFDNNGAYWEAGYAEGLGKPVIYLCYKPHFDQFKTHFDTNHHTTIIWDQDNITTAMENLKATILNTIAI